jgi:drug/metabolite transporter (DMT)-like permease
MTLSPTPSAAGRSAALTGIAYMLAAVFLFGLNSATGKWLVAKYPVGEFLVLRSAMTLILLAPFVWRAGRAAFVNAPRPGLQVVRVLLSSAEVAMFFWAVSHLPLADAQTFYLAGPIYVTALSVIILSERVGWRRWMAVFAGFCGVVIALRPSSASFELPALIALSGSVLYALLMITTRMLRETDDTILMATQFLGIFLFGAVTLPFGWVTPSAPDLAIFAALGFASVISLFCVVRSLKLASASVVVPYQYTLIVWSILFGWIIFGEFPDVSTIAGAAIIVLAGLYIFWRERVTARGVAPPPETT